VTVSRTVPVEPPATRWLLPPAASADEDGLVGVGADLEPGTLLAAYRSGLFPMPLARRGPCRLVVAGSARCDPAQSACTSAGPCVRRCAATKIRIDTAFADVLEGCADPRRPHGWITAEMRTHICGCTTSGGLTRSRPGLATGVWAVGCTEWRSAASSPASRCSIENGTRPRSPSQRLSRRCTPTGWWAGSSTFNGQRHTCAP
jgi:hypothetical protein